MHLKTRQGLVFLLVLLFAGVFYFKVNAQETSRGLQVSPVRFDWDLNSGEERSGIINLKNYDNTERFISIEVEDFYVTDDTTQANFFVPDAAHPLKAYDVINWIDVPKEIRLAPGEGKDISFRVKVPENTPTGGYYGALFFNAEMDEAMENQGSRVKVNQRIGALLVMAIKGSEAIRRSGEIYSFNASRKIFWNKPVEFGAEIFNSGNLHYKIQGNIDIYKFGKKIDSILIESRLVYPGKIRKYQQDWNFSSWAYGYYVAKVNLSSEDGMINLKKEASFWIIPWKTTISIIILLVIIWLTFKLIGSKFEIRRKN